MTLPLWEPTPWAIGSYAEGEMVNVTITPEDVAAAIAVCTPAAESSTYSLSNGQSLDLTGAANDKVIMNELEWSNTGHVVNQSGNAFAVYTGTVDASVQLLIDQHMLQSHQTG